MKFQSCLFWAPFVLTGCAAALVPYSSDPYTMLANADALLEQGRPTPAERLIVQALDSCQTKQEPVCIAEAYRMYGRFFMSSALSGHWKAHYMQNGFKDSSATYEGRYAKALEYLDKAFAIFIANNKYDRATNVKLTSGFIHAGNGDKAKACESFDESLAANIENERLVPDARVILPEGVPSYAAYIARIRSELECAEPKNSPTG